MGKPENSSSLQSEMAYRPH